MKDRMQAYSKSELNLVHDASMDILENTGIGFHHCGAIKLFRENGFRTDASRVFISERDVIQALESVPERFRIHSRNPMRSVWVGGDDYVLLPTGGAPNIAKPDGQQRPAMLSDFQTCCKLVQTSTQLDMTDSLMVHPNDLPPLVAHLDLLLNTIVMCDKPFLVGFDSRYNVDNTIAMAQILSGGKDRLNMTATLAGLISPTSPLQYNDEQAYAVIQLAKHRQPLVITNMIMAGMSGPLTLPGLMVLLNAEILGRAGIVPDCRPGNSCYLWLDFGAHGHEDHHISRRCTRDMHAGLGHSATGSVLSTTLPDRRHFDGCPCTGCSGSGRRNTFDEHDNPQRSEFYHPFMRTNQLMYGLEF